MTAAGALLASCAFLLPVAAVAAPGAQATQTSTVSAVTVRVTPRGFSGPAWDFEVAFDTHSRELDDDLANNAVLVAADGTEVRPIEWKGPPPGGHHRSGTLRFRALAPVPDPVVLRIRRTGEASPRSFQWTTR